MPPTPRRLSADWVLPVERAPIRGGVVLVGEDGRIVAVGEASAVPTPPGVPAEHFAGAVLLPGLVNAHTHLELSGCEGPADASDFPSWIRRIRALKAERSPAEYLAAARRGLAECQASGVTTVADTGDSGAVIQVLSEADGSGIAYHEVFGPDPGDAPAQLAALVSRVGELQRHVSPRVRLGVSPHAPYSVSGELYAGVARWAEAEALPVAVHIAESPEEGELLEAAAGPFAAMWQSRNIPLPSLPGRSPLAWLEQHQVLGPRTLCIHVVQTRGADLDRLRRHGCGIAHCPRSNRRHGHGTAPLADFLAAGLRVGVGTDSAASLSPLDLLAEARAARAIAGLSAQAALELCSLAAARAIGLSHEVGSLAPGKWGDAAVFRIPPGVDEPRLTDTLLSCGAEEVVATFVAGHPVFRG